MAGYEAVVSHYPEGVRPWLLHYTECEGCQVAFATSELDSLCPAGRKVWNAAVDYIVAVQRIKRASRLN